MQGGWPVKRKISRAAWTSRPGARRSAGQAGDQPGRARARPSGRRQPIWREISRMVRRGSAGREEAGRLSGEISWAGRKAVGRSSRRSAGPRARARPSRRAQPIWQEISRVRVGRAAWAAVGEAAPRAGLRGETPPRQPGPDKGRGPSTHEMEGPIRSSSAGHRYLMLSVRTTRSTTKPVTRLKSQLPSSPCVPGCPPDGSVFGSERFLRLSRAGAQEVSASNFKIFWPSTNCPQLSPSYPPVDALSPHEIHRRAAYPVPGGLFGGPTDTVAAAAAVPLALSPGAEPGQPDAVPGQPNAEPGNLAPRLRKPNAEPGNLAPRPRKPDAGQRRPQPDATAGCPSGRRRVPPHNPELPRLG
jgi:hypothetical protein